MDKDAEHNYKIKRIINLHKKAIYAIKINKLIICHFPGNGAKNLMSKFYLTANEWCTCSHGSNTRKLGQETC